MAIKVLVVIDGDFRFGGAGLAADFTFVQLAAGLRGAGYNVTLANRSADTTVPGVIANFNFQSSVNLLDYDVLWMVAREGRNGSLPPDQIGPIGVTELNAIAQFMEAGGGVFATGDHDSIGSAMCGAIPRVRVMRSWYGAGDPQMPPALATVPSNFPPIGTGRADTTLINPMGLYPLADTDGNAFTVPYSYFENQSDTLPQTITPATTPAHPILTNNGANITVYPDHMHEGQAQGVIPGFDYTQLSPFGDTSKGEFRLIDGDRKLPQVIATGQTKQHAVYDVGSLATAPLDPALSAAQTINTLSVYDGRVAGVGRVVTGSTFHHYIDINLSGDSTVDTSSLVADVGPDAAKGHGLTDNSSIYGDITKVYTNIVEWLARPQPAIGLILERSTFSQNEVTANAIFPAAILVTVDGLKPSQFPGTGITTLSPSTADLMAWAPAVKPIAGVPITIVPTQVDSDDPTLSDRLQRFTFTYSVNFTGNAFTFGGGSETVPVQASLSSSAVSAPRTDTAWLELVTGSNPYMLDLDNGNNTTWLSSDIRVFHVVEGDTFQGATLATNATRDDALTFLRKVVSTIDSNQFSALPFTESGGSVLSVAAVTTSNPPKRVYNFALARVRIASAGSDADNVRVFFRIFVTQTTAALTYSLGSGNPLGGYSQTSGANPIALPGTQDGGNEWLSFPMFSADRVGPPAMQIDPDNVKNVYTSSGYRMFGALIDNNLSDPYLTQTPVSGGPNNSLSTILMGAHQCVVTEIIYPGTPIPSGANPATSDKISQRNLAIEPVANPGLNASRLAFHTFEIEATPLPVNAALPPDELLVQWPTPPPRGSYLRLHIPSWSADAVVALADRLYARHEIRAVDPQTIEVPGGGDRYIPIPGSWVRQAGVIVAELPLGIRKGQRFNVSVQQISNRIRAANIPPPRIEPITLEQAQHHLAEIARKYPKMKIDVKSGKALPRGVFPLGANRVLVTDLSLFDASGDHALIVEHPDARMVAAAEAKSGSWRVAIGAFTLGVPVSTKEAMLLAEMQLLSITTWRVEHLGRKSRWYPTMIFYLALLVDKVRALGGDPYAVPPTPDGNIPQLYGKHDDCCQRHPCCHGHKKSARCCDDDNHCTCRC